MKRQTKSRSGLVLTDKAVEVIKVLQLALKLPQTKLEELTGIPQATISAWLNQKQGLNGERAKILYEALGKKPELQFLDDYNNGTVDQEYLQTARTVERYHATVLSPFYRRLEREYGKGNDERKCIIILGLEKLISGSEE